MLLSTAQQVSKHHTANIMISETDDINRFLDDQLMDLEQRFNQFMKEMEGDLIFPSIMANEADDDWNDDEFLMNPSLSNESHKQLISLDKHTTALCLTGSITVTILVYLGIVLSS
jgi:hypothetical protein